MICGQMHTSKDVVMVTSKPNKTDIVSLFTLSLSNMFSEYAQL